jgi:beta-hydroxylase
MSSKTLSPSPAVEAVMLAEDRGHAYRPAAPPANTEDRQTPQARRRELIIRYAAWLTRIADKYFARQSLVPNSPVLDTDLCPWAQELERNWKAVRSELMIVLQNYEHLPRFQDISPDQGRISADDKWRTFFFWGFGTRAERNCQFCPQTSALLEQVPGIQTAFFSILAPGKVVPPHTGITKGLIRAHLAIVVPVPPAECFMDVGDVRCTWQEGQILMFDDTYTHAVSNSADQMRVVLLFDFSRPLKWPGRLLRWMLFSVMRHTPYVQDALRNEARWSRTYYA